MRRLIIAILALGLTLTASPALAKSKVRISGSVTVGSTVTVVAKKGAVKKVRWQRCPEPVVANTCSTPQTIARGRSLTIDSSSTGLSLRAVGKLKGRKVATRWSAPVTANGASSVIVPSDWEIVAGSPSSVTANQAAISSAYAEIDRLVRGGRFLSHFEGGSSGILLQRELTLCSDRSFLFVDGGATGATRFSGTWRMTVNFSDPQDLAPRLVLSAQGGQVSTVLVDLDTNRAGGVFLDREPFLSGPSSSCS